MRPSIRRQPTNSICQLRHLRKKLLYLLLGLLSLLSVLTLSGLPAAVATETVPIALTQGIAQNPSALAEQGQMHYEAGDYEAAVRAWQQAIALLDTAREKLEQARILSNLSLAYQQLGRWDEAQVAISQSLAVLSSSGETSAHQQAVLGQAWAARGALAQAQSRPEEAVEAFETAETFYRAANDTAGILRSQVNQARALQAGGYYRRALSLLEGIQPPLQEQPSSVTV
ncbi:MAG TPA: tetratricopeptide repeat protein, partial [Leptolyngbyaceae cyanobacterium]